MIGRFLLMALLAAPLPVGAEALANQLFGAKATPSQHDSMPIGSYARGCAAGSVELPETGPTWQAMRLSRARNFGHPMMGSVSRGDRLHVHWQPQDAHVFTKT